MNIPPYMDDLDREYRHRQERYSKDFRLAREAQEREKNPFVRLFRLFLTLLGIDR
jgi:hypothetical protein